MSDYSHNAGDRPPHPTVPGHPTGDHPRADLAPTAPEPADLAAGDLARRTKAELRAGFLAARRASRDRAHADAAVRDELVRLATGLGTVAGYVPLPAEPGGPELPDVLAAACHRLIVPVTLPDLDLDWLVYHRDQPPGAGLGPVGSHRRPAARGRFIAGDQPLGLDAVGAADLVVVPAVAVDRAGVRLGRGGGSYDRALTRVPAGTLVVAVVYHEEFVGRLPADPHDRRVAAVVTPSGLHHL